MHKYTITWVELKKVNIGGVEKELYEGEFVNNLGNKVEATIWRFDKDGKEFPGWSEIRPGGEITGNPWTKPGTTKVTIYPPSPEKRSGGAVGAFKQAQIEKTMDKKNENIGKVMDRKEESIRLASAQRDAVLIVTEFAKPGGTSINLEGGPDALKAEIIKWRNWFLNDSDFNNPPPF